MATATITSVSLEQALRTLQSDYAVFYQKLRTYHWNVRGQHFFLLHQQFEKLYEQAAEIQDSLAERLVALDQQPVKTLKDQIAMAGLKEDPTSPDAIAMVRNVVSDLTVINRSLRALGRLASQLSDVTTLNLADSIADANEKTIWMLKALLAK
jgi:starvation-inducible DNA-binding protein